MRKPPSGQFLRGFCCPFFFFQAHLCKEKSQKKTASSIFFWLVTGWTWSFPRIPCEFLRERATTNGFPQEKWRNFKVKKKSCILAQWDKRKPTTNEEWTRRQWGGVIFFQTAVGRGKPMRNKNLEVMATIGFFLRWRLLRVSSFWFLYLKMPPQKKHKGKVQVLEGFLSRCFSIFQGVEPEKSLMSWCFDLAILFVKKNAKKWSQKFSMKSSPRSHEARLSRIWGVGFVWEKFVANLSAVQKGFFWWEIFGNRWCSRFPSFLDCL